MAVTAGFLYLEKDPPGLEQSAEVLGPNTQLPKRPSTLAVYQEVVEQRIEGSLERTAVWQRLISDRVNFHSARAVSSQPF